MKPQPNHEHWLPLTGPGVLLCAQLLALVALLTFRARAGGLPVTGPGIALYCASVLLSVAGFLLLAARRTRTPSTWAVALLILPALSSFVFWWGLGGEFPPWGHHDTEVVLPFFLFLAVTIAAAAAIYGLPVLAMGGYAVQAALYIVHYLPQFLQYPGSNLLGPSPSIFMLMTGFYAVGLVAALLNRGRFNPGLWLAGVLAAAVGGLLLAVVIGMLPQNGEWLGYMRLEPAVPQNAWGWARMLAHRLAEASIVVAALTAVLKIAQLPLFRGRRAEPRSTGA
ncbi:MAG TPA: hypothetical protein VKY39_03190 [Aggregatilineales bacterium]|nr:hypothetical protein [Aggregatilineales bacterium]